MLGEFPQLYLEIKTLGKSFEGFFPPVNCMEPLCSQFLSFRSNLHKQQLINIILRLEKYLKQKLGWNVALVTSMVLKFTLNPDVFMEEVGTQ